MSNDHPWWKIRFLTEEVNDMTYVLSDNTLFRQPHDTVGNGHIAFAEKARAAQDAGSLAMLKSEIARVAAAISYSLVPGTLDDKPVAMASYLAKQKLIVPIPSYYRNTVGNGPIDKWAIRRELQEWNFEPTRIDICIRKRTRFNTNQCYVEITFKKK